MGELIVRRPLLEVYFPGAILDVAEIKSLLSKAGDFTREELEKVSIENLQEYLKRLQNKDPRLTYRITYPYRKTIESLPDLKSEPGLIFSLFDGQKKIDAFARDAEALKLDPPTVQIRMKEAGFKKMQHAITTGSTVEFGDGEIFDVELLTRDPFNASGIQSEKGGSLSLASNDQRESPPWNEISQQIRRSRLSVC